MTGIAPIFVAYRVCRVKVDSTASTVTIRSAPSSSHVRCSGFAYAIVLTAVQATIAARMPQAQPQYW